MADGPAFDPSTMSILVIDDNAQMRTILRSILYSFGVHKVTLAVDGEDALLKLPNRTFDAAICDWLMAPMDGLAFVARVRAHPVEDLRKLPILMLTAQAEMRNVLDARSVGVDAYIVKPVTAFDLWARLETVILRAKQLEPAAAQAAARAIAAASGGLAALADAYSSVLRADCEDLSRGLALLVGDDWDNRDVWNALFKKAHDLKGQAGSFDYGLATDLAGVMCALLRPVRDEFSRRNMRSHHLKSVLQANVNALQLVARENLKGNGGPEGRALLAQMDTERRILLDAWSVDL
jgi:CheY-like chemotaxis protein